MGTDADTHEAKPVKTVFLSGSRKITRLNDPVRQRLRNIIKAELAIMVGDANGADKAMQSFLAQERYRNVTVYFAGETCRNNAGSWPAQQIIVADKLKGRARHTQKDKAMAAKADYGLVLWDGLSIGSLTNICELQALGKKSVVYFSKKKTFFSAVTAADIESLLSHCDADAIDAFENAPILKRKLQALQFGAQKNFNL